MLKVLNKTLLSPCLRRIPPGDITHRLHSLIMRPPCSLPDERGKAPRSVRVLLGDLNLKHFLIILVLMLLLVLHVSPVLAIPSELLRAQGIQRYQASDYQNAVILLQQARKHLPDDVATCHFLGLALIQQGKLREGRQLLSQAARFDGQSVNLLKNLAAAYIAEKNFPWAVRILYQAKELNPRDYEIRQALGLALLRLGQPVYAAEEFTQIRELPGSNQELAVIHLGLALYQSQRWEESRLLLNGWLWKRPQSPIARRIVRAAYQAEGITASLISAELSTGAVVDTNPLYEHETTAPTAVGPTLAGRLVLRPWVDAQNFFEGSLSGSRMFYFPVSNAPPDKNVEDASPSDIRAVAAYQRRFYWAEQPFHFQMSYAFGLTLLDGPPPLTDTNHIFVEEHSGQMALQRLASNNTLTQLRYSIARLQYASIARNNWSNEFSLEHSISSWKDRARFLGWLSLRHEAAHSIDYNTLVPGAGLGGSLILPTHLVFGLRFGYEYKRFYDSEGGRWGKQRLDHNIALAVELGRDLPWNFNLRAVYRYARDFSSVTSFDLNKNLFTLALTWSAP